MQTEKISKALTYALTLIENAVDAHAKGNEDKIVHLTWRAASDLEYGLFLFSLKHPNKPKSSSWKLPPSKQPELESLLASTKNLLEKAASSLEAEDLEETYKKIWMARGQLLRIHDFFEKK